MYYLAKFCRICIKTDVDLMDVDSVDVDSIKLSEKLQECSLMVIKKDMISTKICIQCVKKLRITYDFQKMCKKSNNILQGILSELINNDKSTPNNYTPSEIRVTLSPLKLQQSVRKRITKTERCSILKSLLCKKPQSGGLRDIITFTKNFDFGCEESSLSKLIQFSENYFQRDFTEFQQTVLYIIDNNSLNDDDMFETTPEEVVIEPDIRIKVEDEPMEDPPVFSGYVADCLRTFPKTSVRCRTRGNPYINPQLKKQFMLRSFQCKSCPRYFKTPGYLKAHCAKIHNVIN